MTRKRASPARSSQRPSVCAGMARHLLEVVEDHQAAAAPGDGMAELRDRIVLAQRNVEPLRHGVHDAVDAVAPAPGRRTRRRRETRRASCQPKRVARRVLPVPPMPSTDTRRAPDCEAARQVGQQPRARPTKASRSAGRLCRISRTGSQSVALAHDAVGLVGVGRRQRRARRSSPTSNSSTGSSTPFRRQCPCDCSAHAAVAQRAPGIAPTAGSARPRPPTSRAPRSPSRCRRPRAAWRPARRRPGCFRAA